MSWELKTLGDISISIQTGPFGSQLHQSDYSEEGTPVVMPKDLIGGKISEETIARVSSEHVERLKRHKIIEGDILYSRRGDVGRCAFTTEREKGWLCGTGCLRVTIDRKIADPRFVFFQLQKSETIGWVINHAVGSTMLNLNTSILSDVPIELPKLPIQEKIIKYLSAYDDLIENNKKQINLLEEAAQRLYKEWFVDLRFPGYEDAEIIDGIPDGWTMTSVGELGEFLRGKTITKKQVVEGNIPVVAGGITPAYYHNKSNTEAPVITVSASGNAGFVNVYTTKIWASDCSYLDIDMSPYFYYILCSMKDRQNEIYTLQHGSAQQHVNANQINALEILKPSDEILKQFVALIKPIYEKIGGLIKQSEVASEARDRLLPKLMSGEIEV